MQAQPDSFLCFFIAHCQDSKNLDDWIKVHVFLQLKPKCVYMCVCVCAGQWRAARFMAGDVITQIYKHTELLIQPFVNVLV